MLFGRGRVNRNFILNLNGFHRGVHIPPSVFQERHDYS